MRTFLGWLVGSVFVVGMVACGTSTSSSSSGSSSGRATSTSANEVPPDCLERCEAAAAKCGGADQAFCEDACGKYTETELLCMESAGCNQAAIAKCAPSGSGSTSSSSGGSTSSSSSTSSSGSSSGGDKGTTVSCTTGPAEKEMFDKCASSCVTITVNGTELCAKSCQSDSDCAGFTRCTVNGSEQWCARKCSSHAICKSYGFTTCATGYTTDPTESVCAY